MFRIFSKQSEAVLTHKKVLEQIVALISSRATHIAKTSRKGKYAFPITTQELPEVYVTFCKENIEELIKTLSREFPDTRIQYKPVIEGPDGRMHEVKEMEGLNIPYATYSIVLDWAGAT